MPLYYSGPVFFGDAAATPVRVAGLEQPGAIAAHQFQWFVVKQPVGRSQRPAERGPMRPGPQANVLRTGSVLLNAQQAMPHGGEIIIRTTRSDGFGVLEVADQPRHQPGSTLTASPRYLRAAADRFRRNSSMIHSSVKVSVNAPVLDILRSSRRKASRSRGSMKTARSCADGSTSTPPEEAGS